MGVPGIQRDHWTLLCTETDYRNMTKALIPSNTDACMIDGSIYFNELWALRLRV